MPEEMLKKIKNSVPIQWKVCFVSAFIMGLIAHLYKITNWLPNWDSLVFRYDPQNMISIGRWFLPIVCAPSSFYDLPWLTGLCALLFHGLGAVCVCRMFRVRKHITAALIGALVITFPTVTSVLMYNYVADGYAIAFLLSCMAAMFLVEEKPRYVVAGLCITFSAGIYQAYVTVTVMLLLCHLILDAMRKDTKFAHLMIKSLKFLATGMIGMILYYLILMVLLKITDTALLDYQGVSNALTISGMNIYGALYTIKCSFMDYFFDFSNGISVFGTLNCMIVAVTVVMYLVDIIKQRPSFPKLLLIVFYVICLPIGVSALALINSEVDYHNLMKMGFFVFYLFLILQYEKSDYKLPKLNVAKAWMIFGVIFIFIFHNMIIANVSYHKLNIAYEKSYGTLIRIADRIEQTEGADACNRILVIGALENSEAYSVNLPPDMTGTTDGFILRADDEVVGQSVFCSALNDYCGKNYTFLYGEEKKALLEKVEKETAVGTWPDSNSILVIDDIIIIKLGNEMK